VHFHIGCRDQQYIIQFTFVIFILDGDSKKLKKLTNGTNFRRWCTFFNLLNLFSLFFRLFPLSSQWLPFFQQDDVRSIDIWDGQVDGPVGHVEGCEGDGEDHPGVLVDVAGAHSHDALWRRLRFCRRRWWRWWCCSPGAFIATLAQRRPCEGGQRRKQHLLTS